MAVFFKFIIVSIILFSSAVCFFKPQMHNQFQIYNSEYSPVEEKVEVQEKPLAKKENSLEKKVNNVESKNNVLTTKKESSVKKDVIAIPNEKRVNQIKQEKQITQTPSQKTKTERTLSEHEETIAWNKWHSDIQNSLMNDVKLPYVPIGIVFKFSFTVDKYGKISDIKTWSTTPQYTPYAVEFIAPVIRSYQGKSILTFPKYSKRVVTIFNGGWKISNNSKYSTAADYNDIERYKK